MNKTFHIFSLVLITALFFISSEAPSAETMLGKVSLMGSDGRADLYPLFSGNKIDYSQNALVRVYGGTLIVKENSDVEVRGYDDDLTLSIENGTIYFKIQPSKTIVSFHTKHGDFQTHKIVKASASLVEGVINVSENEAAVELSEGSLVAVTQTGSKDINAGDGVIKLAQAVLEENAEQNGETDGTVADSDEAIQEDDDDDNTLLGAVVFGGAGAAAVTGTIIGASGDGGDGRASPTEP